MKTILPDPFAKCGLVCKRIDGEPHTNIQHLKVMHSPTGFEWGYAGSGPADLAFNTLLLVCPEPEAEKLHQAFKEEFIATMPQEGGRISLESIYLWLALVRKEEIYE